MSGPKRTIYSGGHNQIGLIAVPLIHKDNVRIDIDKYPDARREIEDVFRHFQARLREQKNSAGRKELGPILDSLRKGCVLARVRLSEPWQGLSGIEALQVNGAITEILSEVGLPLDYLRTALKDAERSLQGVEDRVEVVGAAAEKFAKAGGVVLTDEKVLRENFVMGVYDVLVRHALDATTRRTSAITNIVIVLEGTRKSDGDEDDQHRKTVSEWIRAIVKSRKSRRIALNGEAAPPKD